jgi:replicative superfamily II helicase
MITIKATGKTARRPTSDFPYARYKFPTFYPAQSVVLPYIDEDVNIVVDSPMSSGKTLVAEMVGLSTLMRGKGTVLYASPYKQLTEQKNQQWEAPTHEFFSRRRVVLTGDHTGSDPTLEIRLQQAEMVLLTYEMIDARSRKQTEKGLFLQNAGLCIVDECHNLALDKRGDRLEVGLMAFTEKNPDARIVMLSGTIRNSNVLARWLERLNGKKTVLVKATWRPTKLKIHYEPYSPEAEGYWGIRKAIQDEAMEIIEGNPEDQIIAFVHTKDEGYRLVKRLKEEIPDAGAEFHSADLEAAKRNKISEQFIQGQNRVVVATNTLGEGLETPADRTIVLGTKRGPSDVWPVLIGQELARAGRPTYGKDGHGHLICAPGEVSHWRRIIKELPEVESRLAGAPVFRFHVASLVDTGRAPSARTLVSWHRRSLRSAQGHPLTLQAARDMFEKFEERGIVNQISDEYQTTLVGKIAARLYFDPLAVSAWLRNWRTLGEKNALYDDFAVAWAVGFSDHFPQGYGTRKAKEAIEIATTGCRQLGLSIDPFTVPVTAIYWGMQGRRIQGLAPLLRGLRADAWRLVNVWKQLMPAIGYAALDEIYFDKVGLRLQSAMTWTQSEFCRIPEIGPVRSRNLVQAGIETWKDFLASQADGGQRELARETLGEKLYRRACKHVIDMVHAGKLDIQGKNAYPIPLAPPPEPEPEAPPDAVDLPLWALGRSPGSTQQMKE